MNNPRIIGNLISAKDCDGVINYFLINQVTQFLGPDQEEIDNTFFIRIYFSNGGDDSEFYFETERSAKNFMKKLIDKINNVNSNNSRMFNESI